MSAGITPASKAPTAASRFLTLQRIAEGGKPYADLALLVAFPFVLMFLTRAWTFHPPIGEVDTYVYTGFFLNLDKYLEIFPNTYYGSRLPWILAGNTAYWFLSDDTANLALRFLLFYTATFSVYATVRLVWKERIAAVLIALLLGTNVYFHASIGWDYVDGPGLAGICLIFACLTAAQTTKWSRESFFATGLAITTTISTQIALLSILPPLGIWYLSLWYLNRRYSFFGGVFVVAQGVAIAFIFYAMVNHYLTGEYNYMKPQIDFAKRDAENIYIAPISAWIDGAGWLLFPMLSWFISIAFVAMGLFQAIRTRSIKAVDRRLLALSSLCLANLGFAATFAYAQLAGSTALLQFTFYADYLMPLAFLSIGGALAIVLSLASEWLRLRIGIVAGVLILSPYLLGALSVSALPLEKCQACAMEGNGALYALVAALLVIAAFLAKRPALVLAALVAFAFLNPGSSNDFESVYFSDTGRQHDEFLLVYDANNVIAPYDPDGQLKLWIDRSEPLGPVFNGTAGLHLWGYRLISVAFPKWNRDIPDLLVPGRRVAILSAKPDALKLADQELQKDGMRTELIEHTTVRRGDISFDSYVVTIVPAATKNETRLDLAAVKGVAGATVTSSGTGVEITTQTPRWSYSALFTIPEDLKQTYGDSRAFVRVEGIGLKNNAGVGVLKQDRSAWVANAKVSGATKQAFDLYIPIDKLSDTSDVVVFNWDRDIAGQVQITRVTVYVSASP